LTGERGHSAVAAGEDARPYLDAMARMTGPGGLIPEQIWDAEPIPARGLFPGKPSGSAMPLVWAHAEFLKLLAARANGRSAEVLDAVATRWNGLPPRAATWHWRRQTPFPELPAGRAMLIEAQAPFTVAIALDDAPAGAPRAAIALGFAMYGVLLPADELADASRIAFDIEGSDDVAAAHQQVEIVA
jgi:glucoamylase